MILCYIVHEFIDRYMVVEGDHRPLKVWSRFLGDQWPLKVWSLVWRWFIFLLMMFVYAYNKCCFLSLYPGILLLMLCTVSGGTRLGSVYIISIPGSSELKSLARLWNTESNFDQIGKSFVYIWYCIGKLWISWLCVKVCVVVSTQFTISKREVLWGINVISQLSIILALRFENIIFRKLKLVCRMYHCLTAL